MAGKFPSSSEALLWVRPDSLRDAVLEHFGLVSRANTTGTSVGAKSYAVIRIRKRTWWTRGGPGVRILDVPSRSAMKPVFY